VSAIGWRFGCLTIAFIVFLYLMNAPGASGQTGEMTFEIKAFEVTGNSLFTDDQVRAAVVLFTGTDRTVEDVEQARDALEKKYHEAGYPAVMVNIPEQTLQGGIVKLQVIESRIGRVKVTGNRYFTMDKVLRDLPSFTPGSVLYLPQVQKEIAWLNRSQDFKVDPVMSPGREAGTIDVELKVEDHLPLHGYLELNNRATHDTSELRLNAMFHYDNLWQREHSLSLQFQTSPLKRKEVRAISWSYALPSPWEKDDQWALYGIWSDSDTAFGEGFSVVGKGTIFGTRYITLLPDYRLYTHTLTLGVDYKSITQITSQAGSAEAQEADSAPVQYVPLTISYSSSLPDEWGGMTAFSAGLNMNLRSSGSQNAKFEYSRYMAQANYLAVTASVQRKQKLPLSMNLVATVDGQLSDQPLVSSEQYTAGGMASVRGYKETEVLGDSALHGMFELIFPDSFERWVTGGRFQMSPFLFYDFATLAIKEPLPGQDDGVRISGTGAGVRGSMAKNLEYELDWGVALKGTDRTEKHAQRFYFLVRTVF
jgi:hemolysin activation/secretion protein